MINISYDIKDNVILNYTANGHAENVQVCGAVSITQSTYVKLLNKINGVTVNFKAPEKGVFNFNVEVNYDTVKADTQTYLKGLTNFFMSSLNDLYINYSDDVNIKFK